MEANVRTYEQKLHIKAGKAGQCCKRNKSPILYRADYVDAEVT
jgi:hypothetical protein